MEKISDKVLTHCKKNVKVDKLVNKFADINIKEEKWQKYNLLE